MTLEAAAYFAGIVSAVFTVAMAGRMFGIW